MLAQVGIGTQTPDNTAALEISSNSKGVLVPRLTAAERDAIFSPAAGLIIYNKTTNTLNFFNGAKWTTYVDDQNTQTIAGEKPSVMILSPTEG